MTGPLARHRTTVLLVVAGVLLLVLVAWVESDRAQFGGALDPRNPKPTGAQAVARVLADHGVDVRIARGQDAFLGTRIDRSTAVVVANADELGRSTLARFDEHAAAARTTLLVGSSSTLLGHFDLTLGGAVSGRVPADCQEPLLRDLAVRVPDSVALDRPGCFRSNGSSVVVRADPRSWVVTAPALFSNRDVLKEDNAAVALRLLGQQRRLVWYVADPADTTSADAVSLGTFLPPWLVPALWLLAVSVVGFLLWRARRLGPLVREPMPVVVRAAESTESRARLYRRSHDRDHAARILRAATRRTLADRLALPADDTATVTTALPEHRDLLTDAPVADDAALTRLGRDLNRLEDEVQTR